MKIRIPDRFTDKTASSQDETQSWLKDRSEGRKHFWTAVHNRYKRRDISRERVLALVDFGLRPTHRNCKMIASAFRLKEKIIPAPGFPAPKQLSIGVPSLSKLDNRSRIRNVPVMSEVFCEKPLNESV